MSSMIRPAFVTLACALLVSACAGAPPDNADTPAPDSSAVSAQQYRCESGATITASYPTEDTARVKYENRRYDLQIAVSGSGARYVGDELEWWTKGAGSGAEGVLFQHKADGTTGERMELCTAS